MNPIQPVQLNLEIPAGSSLSITPRLVTKATGEALPLNGYAPFTAACGRAPGRTPVLEITVDNSQAASGLLTLSVTAADTADCTGILPWDLIDKNGARWVYGKIDFRKTITPAPTP